MATQQVKPSRMDLPPVFTSFMMLELNPIAPIAMTMKNLLTCLSIPNTWLAVFSAAPERVEVSTVVMTGGEDKVEHKYRKDGF